MGRGRRHLFKLNSSIYDKITISFGIRNIPDIDSALREMRRVARPGALLGVLEFALPESGLLAPVARAFVSVVVPVLGAVLSGARFDEYAHLARSIAEFPSPDKFRERSRPRASRLGNRSCLPAVRLSCTWRRRCKFD